MEYIKSQQLADEFEKYSNLEGAELGEACAILIACSRYPSYLSDKFYKSLCDEMLNQLNNFKNNSRIVERTETRTHTWKELIWEGIDY